MSRAAWVGRVASLALLVGALGALERRGRGALPPPPRPSPSASASAAPGPASQQVLRTDLLVDRLDQARFVVPRLSAGLKVFRASHWRAMTAPHARVHGSLRQAVQVVALTVGGTEKALDTAKSLGLGSAADLRTWNSAEASFDVREAILAPPPSTIVFDLAIPPGAALEFSPTATGLKAGSVTFEVAVRPASGERVVVDTSKIRASEALAWHDRRVDLGAFAGQTVELELTVRGGPAAPDPPPAALWGSPTLVAPGRTELPYNVLWFVIDTMRPDPLEAWHPPERREALARARLAPHEAWLPPVPGLAPAIEGLAARGVAFLEASSAATWTRPGTLSMLAGARSSQLGLDTTPWILPSATVARFYASSPPMLPLLLRRYGVRSQALVNNFFLTGYARAGVDTGFVGMIDHRHETLDTQRISRDALAWLDQHQRERFFLFVNLNSPHGPYSPPPRCLSRVPKNLPEYRQDEVRRYVAEICKDDEAVGQILEKLRSLGLDQRTLVILTADHGETLSREHDVVLKNLDAKAGSTRFHHASAMFDETARVPLILSLPGALPQGERRMVPAQTTDIVPTILELEGIPAPEKVRGSSLLAWARGAPAPAERPVFTEGRACRSVRVGRYRYVERDEPSRYVVHASRGVISASEELYDLEEDPGERSNIAPQHPDITARMRERLAEALATSTAHDALQSASLAGSRHAPRDTSPPARLRLRFAGAGQHRRFTLSGRVADPEAGAPEPRLKGSVFQADPDALRVQGRSFDVTLSSTPSGLVGIDLEISPSSTPISWEIFVDDRPLPPDQIFGGTYGLLASSLLRGVLDAEGRLAATAEISPVIDPRRDLGVFVARDPSADVGLVLNVGGEALGEVQQLLQTWGYAAPAK